MRRLVRRCRQRGAVAVEFALVLPLFLLLVLGGIDWGYYFFTAQVAANAAREGARAASLVATTPCVTGRAVAINYLQRGQLINSTMDPRAKAFDPTCPSTMGNGCCQQSSEALPGGAGSIDVVRVTIVYQAKPGSGMSLTGFLPPALLPPTVVATAVMRYEP